MKNKIKQILEKDINPFELISKNNNNYIIKIKFEDNLSGLPAQLTIDFNFIFDKINFLFVENSTTIQKSETFNILKDWLIFKYKTSELSQEKLFEYIWIIIYDICCNLHTELKHPQIKLLNDSNIIHNSKFQECMNILKICK